MLTVMTAMAAATLAQADVPDWSALARSDIEFMHAQTQAHHPGPVDDENPDFRTQMEIALERGLSLAARVDSQAGYAMALRAYAAHYRDGHYGVGPRSGVETYQWPGFVTIRTGGRWFVRSGDASAAALDGHELLDCDGRTVDDWMQERIFDFAGNPDLVADWAQRAPHLMVERGNPFIGRPGSCRLSDGESVETVSLEWQDIDADTWWEVSDTLSQPEPAPWGLHEFAPNAFWIGMPTFAPQGENLENMHALIAELEERADELRAADLLVFDVRSNNGGASSWGDAIVNAVWGEDYAAYRAPALSDGVDYRISDENIDHARFIIDFTVEQNMTDAETYFREVYAGMLAASEAGEDLYRERREARDMAPAAENPVTARVYFLTDSACGSACLDFADRMYALEGVTHIGGETYADSAYMELRTLDLPSGYGSLGLPIKVYRGRPRASGETYVPERVYSGTDWTTPALQTWVAGLGD
jgi:hypothetical protein